MTFTFDGETVKQLELAAARLRKPKSMVVREAIKDFASRTDKLSDAERRRMLEAFDRYIRTVPPRRQAEVDAEIAEIRAARRRGGRRHPVE